METLRAIWAKSPKPNEREGQSLAAHIIEVWKSFLACRERAPGLAELTGDDRFWARAALAALAHDLGKCAPGFQKMLRGQGFFHLRHEVLSLAAVEALWDLSPEDMTWVAAGILSHHKDLGEIRLEYLSSDPWLGLPDGLEAIESELTPDFWEGAICVARHCILPLLEQGGFSEIAARLRDPATAGFATGVQKTRDLMNRVVRLHECNERAEYCSPEVLAGCFLRGVLQIADHCASAGQRILGCSELKAPDRVLAALGLCPGDLFDHQQAAMHIAGNGILVAPTGSGKTEAALLWAAAQGAASEGQPVLFYVLPYQASLNAMRWRLGKVFGQNQVALVHSRALSALYRGFIAQDCSPAEAARRARREVALAGLHAAPIRLLTPYQLLRAAYQLRGHETIWTEAASSLMVFDELHAYEPRRLGMILAMLSHLSRHLRARLLVISATIPAPLVRLLQQAIGPALVVRSSSQTFSRFRRHRLHLLDKDLLDADTVELIADDARDGLKVLVVANTVARAQTLWHRLAARAAMPVMLLHGRFNAEDRAEKEQTLLERGSQQPLALVATQVVEVSLDLDFDVLYSDPAPLEALIQRFGRVNRRRERPERNVFVMTRRPDSDVYCQRFVELALQALRAFDGQLLDEECLQIALDQVYQSDIGPGWEAAVAQSSREFKRDVLACLKPFRTDERLEQAFATTFDGLEVLPAQLQARYRQLVEVEPLLAPSLLVPVSHSQYRRLDSNGLASWQDGLCVVKCPYDNRLGLQFPWADLKN